MKRRYEGFPANGGLVVLDTFPGEVKFIPIDGMSLADEARELNSISGLFIKRKITRHSKQSLRNFMMNPSNGPMCGREVMR